MIDEVRARTSGGDVLGDGRFKRAVAAAIVRRTWRGRPGRPANAPADDRQDRDAAPTNSNLKRSLPVLVAAITLSCAVDFPATSAVPPIAQKVINIYDADHTVCDPLASAFTGILHRNQIGGNFTLNGGLSVLKRAGLVLPPLEEPNKRSIMSPEGDAEGVFNITDLNGHNALRYIYIHDRCDYCFTSRQVTITWFYILKPGQRYFPSPNDFPLPDHDIIKYSNFGPVLPKYGNIDNSFIVKVSNGTDSRLKVEKLISRRDFYISFWRVFESQSKSIYFIGSGTMNFRKIRGKFPYKYGIFMVYKLDADDRLIPTCILASTNMLAN
jgi:hypothetical protein